MDDMKDEAVTTDLMPIGTFAQMTRLSVKSLRFYGERDLIHPAHVDESSGYRYYSHAQVGRAVAIGTLRALDMPIDQIKRVLDSSPETVQAELETHRMALEERIVETSRAADILSDFIEGRKQLMPYDIETKTMPAHHVASCTLQATLQTIAEATGQGFGSAMQAVGSQGLMPMGIPYTVYHDIIDADTSGSVEYRIPVAPSFEGVEGVESLAIDDAQVAFTVHRGPYFELGGAYQALMQWMEGQGRAPAGPPREIYLNDPTQVSESELLTEIAWPI